MVAAIRFASMHPLHKNILITGLPGVGKTTLIRKIIDSCRSISPSGFYTAEIREGGVRKGFDLVDLDGTRLMLAHVDFTSHYQVGKYGVDLDSFETYLARSDFLHAPSPVVFIDEIGKMECLSKNFITLVEALLESQKQVIATIGLKSGGAVGRIRNHPDIFLMEITPASRNSAALEIIDYLAVRFKLQ